VRAHEYEHGLSIKVTRTGASTVQRRRHANAEPRAIASACPRGMRASFTYSCSIGRARPRAPARARTSNTVLDSGVSAHTSAVSLGILSAEAMRAPIEALEGETN